MGLEKDVLLISESTLVLNLPADLRNWECLTYDKGNYDQLADRVQNFLCDNYGLSPQKVRTKRSSFVDDRFLGVCGPPRLHGLGLFEVIWHSLAANTCVPDL